MIYKILINYGAFKSGGVVNLRAIPNELLSMGVLKEAVIPTTPAPIKQTKNKKINTKKTTTK